MLKNYGNIIWVLAIVISEVSFFNFLPYLNYVNILLAYLLYLIIKQKDSAVPAIFLAGYLLDFYSPYTFGVHTLALLLTLYISYYISCKILTNHRFSPLILLLNFSIALYHLLVMLFSNAIGFLKLGIKYPLASGVVLKNIGLEIFYTTLAALAAYAILRLAANRLSKKFIVRA